ncbi:MAG TPA: hypothetical protein VD902_09940, partial [Symbiobacteriaceae bacterium]|nr:hypothetical protein [Symbiobacteriaceae bacterium]
PARTISARGLRPAQPSAPVQRPGPANPRIVSSAHGPLGWLLFCYPAYAAGEYTYRDIYTDLFRKLPGESRLTVLTHPEVLGDLQRVVAEAGVSDRTTIVEAPAYLDFLVWAEDPYVVVHDPPSAIFLVEPFTFTRGGDAVIADLVAEAEQMRRTQSPLYFQGGNILVGDDFVLIGEDYPVQSVELIREHEHVRVPGGGDPPAFVKELYRTTFDPDRKILYVGTRLPVPREHRRTFTNGGQVWKEDVYAGTGEHQPIFHIDMFITLAGRGPSGKYRLLVGSPAEAARVLDEKEPSPYALAAQLDDVAASLAAIGFEVIRNPLPLTYVDDRSRRLRTWYFATANNCLVQIDEKAGNHVWLPTYGHGDWGDLRATDEANRALWQDLGFAVHLLGDFHPFAQNLGAVHCIKKYLAR